MPIFIGVTVLCIVTGPIIGGIMLSQRGHGGHYLGDCNGDPCPDEPDYKPPGEVKREADFLQTHAQVLREAGMDLCTEDIKGANLSIDSVGTGNDFQVTGIPATCMTAASNVASTSALEMGTHPSACGTDCLLYENLTKEEFEQIQQVLVVNLSA